MTLDEHLSAIRAQLCELKVDRDRLAGEVRRLEREQGALLDQIFDLERRLHMYGTIPMDQD